MAKATVAVYPHRDVDALDAMLEGAERSIVVSDSVFSMDGDVAPIDDLAEVCARHGSLLVLDEAHAVLGPDPERADDLDRIRVGTLSKFLGAMGGFVAADARLHRPAHERGAVLHLHDRVQPGRCGCRSRRVGGPALGRGEGLGRRP